MTGAPRPRMEQGEAHATALDTTRPGRRSDDEVATQLQKDALPDTPQAPTVVVPTITPSAR
jgi:hypothetical protein